MRKVAIFAALALVAGTTVAQAQRGAGSRGAGRSGGRGGPGAGIDMMLLHGITLTDAQKAKLKDLHEAELAKMQDERGSGRGNFEAIREAREKGDTVEVRRLME